MRKKAMRDMQETDAAARQDGERHAALVLSGMPENRYPLASGYANSS